MSDFRIYLTAEESATLDAMSKRVMGGLDTVTHACREATKSAPSLQLQAAIASYIAHIAGQMIARAEFVALNAGGTEEAVHTLCGGAFNDGRDAAYAEVQKSGVLKSANAPTTGAPLQ
ncbi:hypothetical protein V5F32_00980 [Xanthobacter oligotrophicus]|uniref:Uncharacterized protein n=1 Tax=Xanthobacter oligotrophicus TaxID=2607286 RepID=A0ABW6ZPU0_9HYPH